MRAILLVVWVLAVGIAIVPAWAQGDVPGEELVLIQSELDHLKSRDVAVLLRFDRTEPREVFDALSKAAGFELEIRGKFPEKTRVTITKGKAPLKEALVQLARDLPVYYHVPEPTKLIVIVERRKD